MIAPSSPPLLKPAFPFVKVGTGSGAFALAGGGTISVVRHSGHCACLPTAAAVIRNSF